MNTSNLETLKGSQNYMISDIMLFVVINVGRGGGSRLLECDIVSLDERILEPEIIVLPSYSRVTQCVLFGLHVSDAEIP